MLDLITICSTKTVIQRLVGFSAVECRLSCFLLLLQFRMQTKFGTKLEEERKEGRGRGESESGSLSSPPLKPKEGKRCNSGIWGKYKISDLDNILFDFLHIQYYLCFKQYTMLCLFLIGQFQRNFLMKTPNHSLLNMAKIYSE